MMPLPLPKIDDRSCEACDSDHEHAASVYCTDCALHLCDEMAAVHRKFRVTSSHKLVPLREARENITRARKKSELAFCTTHMQEHKAWCQSCKALCCLSCVILDHKAHEICPLDSTSVSKPEAKEITELIQTVRVKVEEAKDTLDKIQRLKKEAAQTFVIENQVIDAVFTEVRPVCFDK